MARSKYDWDLTGSDIISLYVSGLSVREVVAEISNKYGIEYPSGTLTHYLGKHGVLRSKAEAHRLAVSKQRRVCEICEKEYVPRNYNQRWCDECTGNGKYTRRVRIHGLPASLYEHMLVAQENKCKICGTEFETCLNTRTKKTLYVDHDHETGQVRGLLCPRCNAALSFIDNRKLHDAALAYIEAAKREQNKVYVRPPRKHRYVNNTPVAIRSTNTYAREQEA